MSLSVTIDQRTPLNDTYIRHAVDSMSPTAGAIHFLGEKARYTINRLSSLKQFNIEIHDLKGIKTPTVHPTVMTPDVVPTLTLDEVVAFLLSKKVFERPESIYSQDYTPPWAAQLPSRQ